MDRRLYQKIIVGLLVAVSGQQALYAQTPEQWRDSLTVLSKAIVQHPQSIDLRLKKAAVNIELSQWDYAVEEYGLPMPMVNFDAMSWPRQTMKLS